MTDIGINHGSLLVVDKALEPQDKDIVIAFSHGDFLVKRYRDKMESATSPVKTARLKEFLSPRKRALKSGGLSLTISMGSDDCTRRLQLLLLVC